MDLCWYTNCLIHQETCLSETLQLLVYQTREQRRRLFLCCGSQKDKYILLGWREMISSLRLFLHLVFPESSTQKTSSQPEGGDFDHVPNKRRKQFLSALVALGAMLSYALLTGILSIQHAQQEALEAPPDLETIESHEEEEGDG